jgi:hypothetical protein
LSIEDLTDEMPVTVVTFERVSAYAAGIASFSIVKKKTLCSSIYISALVYIILTKFYEKLQFFD